jgi:GAF domain-containing protein
MAKTTRKAGKPATAAGRDELRARKPAMAKTRDGKSRKPKPARPGPRKGKPSLPSETASLKRQLKTARLQQQASAEILRAVANASGDVARPLQQIAETTARLFKASSVSIQLAEDTEFTQEYRVGAIAKRVGSAYPRSNIRVGGRNLPGTVVAESRQIHIPDLDRLDPSMSDFPGLPHARAGGARTVCGTPLRREDKAIGALIVFRDRLLPFIDDELALLQSFADQAVIAIENARLFNNTQEALARQTASADILRVISQSPTDVQPVFDAIALAAVRLLGCERAFIQRCDGASFWTVSWCGPEGQLPILNASPIPIDPEANFPSRAISENRTLHLPDWSVIDLPEFEREIQKKLGINSALYMPLLREGECIGLLAMAGKRTNIFGASEIALAESFRDQALIAIENTRLFDETQEALERQTASADILKVIASSPSDVQPVFNAVVLTTRRLLGREMAAILLCGDDAAFRAVAGAGPDGLIPIDPAFATPTKIDPEANFPSRAIVSKKNLHLPDWSAIDLPEQERNIRKMVGWNSTLYLPMLRGDECIGVLLLGGTQPGIFNEADIALAESFRDQALIAIENTRLFNETREALERQTATADILKVIASSPDDAQPVFEAIAEQSKRLVEALSTTVFRLEDGLMHLKAYTPTNPEADATLRAGFPAPLARFSWGPAISHGDVYRVLDTEQEIESLRQLARLRGFRSMLFVPLLRDGTPIGVIAVTRVEPGPFVEHHVQLLQTFADQAVIAIGNVRLFEEVQAKTHELSQSLDELRTAQDRLVQTEKLASLGQLTAGIAHEIKNPLNFVNNFSALSAELVDEMTEVL